MCTCLCFCLCWRSAAAGMESRAQWRTYTASQTILSTGWKSLVLQGALQCGCCSPDTSQTRSKEFPCSSTMLLNSITAYLLLMCWLCNGRPLFYLIIDVCLLVSSGWFCTKQGVYHPGCLQNRWQEGLLSRWEFVFIKKKKKPFFSICRVLSVFVPEQLTPLPTLMASALTAHIIWPRWGWPPLEHTPSPWWSPSMRNRTPSTTHYGSVRRYSSKIYHLDSKSALKTHSHHLLL